METVLLATGLALIYVTILLGIEITKRKFNLSGEMSRRIVHIFTGLTSVIYFQLLPAPHFVTLSVISLIVVLLSQRFGWFTSIHSVKRKTYGEIFLPLGTLGTWAITQAEPKTFIPSMLIMTLADSSAGLVSDFLKQSRKMFRGSIMFFIVALAILLLSPEVSVLAAIAFALALTLVERYSPLGSDNFTVPVAGAVLLSFLKF
jgi:dolichol kinase